MGPHMQVAVIGSITPWLEALLLNHGAAAVTTVEHNVPVCAHPKLRMQHYDDFVASKPSQFDAVRPPRGLIRVPSEGNPARLSAGRQVVSYSSVEHAGLGRYGDPLDPDGDLKAMRAIHRRCMLDATHSPRDRRGTAVHTV